MDLFDKLSTQCPLYFSWRPDPYAAISQDWTAMKYYANPPWNLVGRVLTQVQFQQVQVELVALVWKAQPWFPALLNNRTLLTVFVGILQEGDSYVKD